MGSRTGSLFTPDADWVNVRGNRWVGIEQIRKNHVAIHALFFSESTLTFSDISIRMVTPDAAVVHARETITNSNMPEAAGVGPDSQMSLVLVCRDTGWLIANGQNTNVALPAAEAKR